MTLFMTLKYALIRWLLKSVGRLSDGIRLGWRTGFDSGVMLEYVYENRPRGVTPLGRVLDRAFLSHPVWDGVRSRRQLLVAQLTDAMRAYERPTILDLAAGPGSYLFLLPAGEAQIIAGDYEMEAVALGQMKAREQGRDDIVFHRHDAIAPGALAASRADILVSSGFFDILTQEADILAVLRNGAAVTQPGARWVFTIQEHHPDLRLLKESMVDLNQKPWELTPRPAEQLVAWAQPMGWTLERLERNAYFAVGTLLRREADV